MVNSNRRSTLCPRCRKLISVDEIQCPHCGLDKPASWWKNNAWTRGLGEPGRLINAITYANVAMFITSLLLNPGGSSMSLNPFAMLSPDNQSLLLLGATGTLPIDRLGRWWSLLSANYLHGGLLHILFNMVALRQIGPLIFEEYGGYRMFVIYTLGGVAGYLVSYLAGVTFTIGASAAVCGLIGAALYYGKTRGGYYGQAIYRQVGGWVLGLFLFGLLVPGIDNWAHGGGIVGGALVGLALGYGERRPEGLGQKLLAGVCAASTLGVLVWAGATSVVFLLRG